MGDTETDNEKSSKKNIKASTEKSKDTAKDKNIEEKDPHDDLLDDGGDNVIDEYEEQPKGEFHWWFKNYANTKKEYSHNEMKFLF